MVTINIDKLTGNLYNAIESFYMMNEQLSNVEYMDKFEKTFRCKAYRNPADINEWLMEFTDEEYTWFLLRWS